MHLTAERGIAGSLKSVKRLSSPGRSAGCVEWPGRTPDRRADSCRPVTSPARHQHGAVCLLSANAVLLLARQMQLELEAVIYGGEDSSSASKTTFVRAANDVATLREFSIE